MLTKRLIVCMTLRDGRTPGPTRLADVRDPSDAAEVAERYQNEGADEIVFLDASGSADTRRTLLETVQRAAERLNIPLTLAGGGQEIDDIARALRAGADKVSIGGSAVRRPDLLSEAARMFGSGSIVASIEARRERRALEMALREQSVTAAPPPEPNDEWYRVFTDEGETATNLDAVEWAAKCASLGAGEVMITSIDERDASEGYDLELTARIVEAVKVPVVARGGAARLEHLRDAFVLAGADGAMAEELFHSGATSVPAAKRYLQAAGVSVRRSEPRRKLERLAAPE